MTEPKYTGYDEQPMEFTTPQQVDRERVRFVLDGEDLYARKPKGGTMLQLALNAVAMDDEMEQATIIEGFLDKVMEPDTAQRIRDRLFDDDDDFDLDTLTDIINALQTRWGGRPPTRSRPSSPRRRRTGPRSTARTRAVG